MDQDRAKAYLYLRFKVIVAVFAPLIILASAYLGISSVVLFSDFIVMIFVYATGILLWLNIKQLKRPIGAIHVSLATDLLALLVILYMAGGPESTWGFLPIIAVVVAGYLFGWRAVFIYATASFGLILTMFGLEYWQMVPHYSNHNLPFAYWHNADYLADYLLGMFMFHFLTAASSGYYNFLVENDAKKLRQSTAEAVAAREESEAAKQQIMKAREELELRVSERTRDLEDARRATLHLLKDLREDVIKLEAVDRMKTEFISMVGHELRGPLTPIKGYLSLVLEDKAGQISDQQREALGTVVKQSNYLEDLIDSLLDLSRLELGKPIPIVKEPLSIKQVFDDIIEAVKIELDKRQQDLKIEIVGDLPAIMADGVKLKRVLSNLVGNAIKFTSRGGEIKMRALTKENGGIRIEVIDNGIGIPQDLLEKIFEKFYQIDSSYTRETGGIGMGLTIARELVELHGGRLWAESAGPGKGSKFIVELPVEGEKRY
jgi:signal transduction histidine kinase